MVNFEGFELTVGIGRWRAVVVGESFEVAILHWETHRNGKVGLFQLQFSLANKTKLAIVG